MPPYWDSQRNQVDSAIPNWRQTSSTDMSPAKSFCPSASFRMICLVCDVDETSIVLPCPHHDDADDLTTQALDHYEGLSSATHRGTGQSGAVGCSGARAM